MLSAVSLTFSVDQSLSGALTARASALRVHPEVVCRRALAAFLLAPTAHPVVEGQWAADVDHEFWPHLPIKDSEYS